MIKTKVIIMFSGGLDSLLAVKIMQEQNFAPNQVGLREGVSQGGTRTSSRPSMRGDVNTESKIIAVYFKLPFSKDIEKEVGRFAKKEKIKLKIFDCTRRDLFQEYLRVIRNPKYGRGSGLNPCIDCRIFLLKKVKEFAGKNDLIVTGEVLGERPMSQMKKSMNLIEEKSGLRGRLLRPLSAKLLPETEAEKNKLVDRKKFYDLQGRRREKQISLAEKFKISYPGSGGGCLLCEKLYCEKLKKILNKKNLNYKDIQLLKIGRHFEASKIILGRNKEENELLEKAPLGVPQSTEYWGKKAIKIIPKQAGPTALVKNKKYQKKAKELIQKYSKNKIEGFEVKN